MERRTATSSRIVWVLLVATLAVALDPRGAGAGADMPAPAAVVATHVPAPPSDPLPPPPCPVTRPVAMDPPEQPERNAAVGMARGALGPGDYFRSPDGRIVTHAYDRYHVGGTKVLWLKPVGARLEVSGRRLDGPAPPLGADLPAGYPGDYQASGMTFPTAGCWEVTARADGSVLRFVVWVAEARPRDAA